MGRYVAAPRSCIQTAEVTTVIRTSTDSENGKWLGSLLFDDSGLHPREDALPKHRVFVADINVPELRLKFRHMQKYSQFGISFSKHFLAKRLAQRLPNVMYFPYWQDIVGAGIHGANALRDLEAHIRQIAEGDRILGSDINRDFLMKFIAYVKPFNLDTRH